MSLVERVTRQRYGALQLSLNKTSSPVALLEPQTTGHITWWPWRPAWPVTGGCTTGGVTGYFSIFAHTDGRGICISISFVFYSQICFLDTKAAVRWSKILLGRTWVWFKIEQLKNMTRLQTKHYDMKNKVKIFFEVKLNLSSLAFYKMTSVIKNRLALKVKNKQINLSVSLTMWCTGPCWPSVLAAASHRPTDTHIGWHSHIARPEGKDHRDSGTLEKTELVLISILAPQKWASVSLLLFSKLQYRFVEFIKLPTCWITIRQLKDNGAFYLVRLEMSRKLFNADIYST